MSSVVVFTSDEAGNWTPNETVKLLEQWTEKIAEVNKPKNEAVLSEISKLLGKNTKQVEVKIKQMKERYLEEREKKFTSKWRYYSKLHQFDNEILTASDVYRFTRDRGVKRKAPAYGADVPSPLKGRTAPLETGNRLNDVAIEAGINRVVDAIDKLGQSKPQSEMPPVYPFDNTVPVDVTINASWREWNDGLPYQLTDGGIRTLIRSGFKDVSQIGLLKTKPADVSMLHLNYHDRLALHQAMEANSDKAEKFELVTNTEGAVIGIHGSVDASDAILLTDDGLKMLEWNRTLAYPISLRGLAKVLKSGFTSAQELSSLLTDEFIDYIDLNLRDRIILHKYVMKNDEKTASSE